MKKVLFLLLITNFIITHSQIVSAQSLKINESPRKNHLISRFNGFYLFVHFICAHIRNFI